MRHDRASPPRSILIVRLSALGDAIHVLPSLNRLRVSFPTAKIGWAVEDRAADLLRDHPQLDRIHTIPRQAWKGDLREARGLRLLQSFRAKVTELRRERYDVALDFQSNLRSSLCTWLSGAPRRIGQPAPFSKEGSRAFFTDVAPPIPFEAHKIERNLNLLAPLGIERAPARRGLLPMAEAPGLADDLPPKGDRPWVVLHPGVSTFGALKAWRPERFGALAAGLLAADCEVFFSWGGEGERRLAEALAHETPGARVGPRTSLSSFATFLRMADLFVGVDSGPLHLAAMVGTPVLGLYGPKHVSTYGPFWSESDVVRADYPCSPCRYRRCPRPEAEEIELPTGARTLISPCMDSIAVATALESALGSLQEPPRSVG